MKVDQLKKVAWFSIGIVAVISLGICTILFIKCREPNLDGRPATFWIRDLSLDSDRHDAALVVFRHQGAKAVPGLVSTFDPRRSEFASWLDNLPFHDLMPSRIKTWTDHRKLMTDMDRVWAVRICGIIGPDASAARPALEIALTDRNPAIRAEAATALAETKASPETTVPIIARLLSDQNSVVRSKAAVALGTYHEAARPAAAMICALTNDPSTMVVFSARLAIAMIEEPEKVVVKTNAEGKSYQLRP